MGVKKEPSTYYKDPLNQNKKPPGSLDLEFVFGYNGNNSRNNLKFNKTGNIVYYTAAIAIVLEFDNLDKEVQLKKQHYFNHHTEEITCLDMHTDQIRIATG